ncbi:hypothetical protein LOTGIDRAFT_174430 [Lottia gigantea]|uniref:Uncharacterized protein n=1 Tax=Lottia gigantea TaxID=225164 RepID=V4AWX3_LOTGI|nr:hypothetical protein LOTGIDRAFT_174430 [Lottia gigantea]ESO98031.1 hypothetical protein LOTGIDRAFT_174430 [Lottia gigantea]
MENRLINLETEIKLKVSAEQVNDIVKSLIGSCVTNEAKIDIEKSVELKVAEIRDSSSREKNIIIHGAPECKERLPSSRKEADTLFAKELADYLRTSTGCIGKVMKIGKQSDDLEKPRPMKVCLNNTEDKKSFMINLSKLKNAEEGSKFCNISVTHDMTKSERELNKAMFREAKEKTEKD